MKALIDGDIVAYRVAAIAENTFYMVGKKPFTYKKDAKNYCLINGLDILNIKKLSSPYEDFEIERMLSEDIERITEKSGSDVCSIYLTGDGSFRKNLYPAYKANRIYEKPSKLQFVRELLINQYDTRVVSDIEADDALGIKHLEDSTNTVICTIDKDLLMIPGNHYNWKNDEFFEVYPEEADFNFFKQLLIGDSTDNICGVKKIGPEKAMKMLSEGCNTQEWYDIVAKEYIKYHTIGTLSEINEIIDLNAQLLWIKRGYNSTWREIM